MLNSKIAFLVASVAATMLLTPSNALPEPLADAEPEPASPLTLPNDTQASTDDSLTLFERGADDGVTSPLMIFSIESPGLCIRDRARSKLPPGTIIDDKTEFLTGSKYPVQLVYCSSGETSVAVISDMLGNQVYEYVYSKKWIRKHNLNLCLEFATDTNTPYRERSVFITKCDSRNKRQQWVYSNDLTSGNPEQKFKAAHYNLCMDGNAGNYGSMVRMTECNNLRYDKSQRFAPMRFGSNGIPFLIKNKNQMLCFQNNGINKRVTIATCTGAKNQVWEWSTATFFVRSKITENYCLTKDSDNYVSMRKCDFTKINQWFGINQRTYLASNPDFCLVDGGNNGQYAYVMECKKQANDDVYIFLNKEESVNVLKKRQFTKTTMIAIRSIYYFISWNFW